MLRIRIRIIFRCWIRIRIKEENWIRIRISIKVKNRIRSASTSEKLKWSIGGSISGEKLSGRIRDRIKLKSRIRIWIRIHNRVKDRIRIRIKVKSRIRIRINGMRIRNTVVEMEEYTGNVLSKVSSDGNVLL